jgi:hypothetical protein
MVNRLGQLALQDGSDPSPNAHFELLRMIDQLRLAVETPTETVLRLIYQVSSVRPVLLLAGVLTIHSLRKMLRFVRSWT